MIFTDRIITVRKGESKINEPIIVYRGDYELEVRFTIMNSKFKFMSGTNLIESENAAYGQLAILTPYGGNIFSEIAKCNEGTVTFVLTKAMLDQIEEVGLYSFQIRLFDYNKESRVSIPPVEFGIEVREPITSEDHDNSVNNAIVGYSIAKIADALNEKVPDTFNGNGDYNKTVWETGDRITEGKLNKIEEAIDTINQNEKNDVAALDKRITSNFSVLDSTKADINEVRLKTMYNTLNDCDAEMLAAIQNKDGETTFNLTSIPRDGSVTFGKLDQDSRENISSYEVLEVELHQGYYDITCRYDGMKSHNDYLTIKQPCHEGEMYNCDCKIDTSSLATVVFFKENGAQLSRLNLGVIDTYSHYEFTVPEDACYLAISSGNTVTPVLRKLKYKNVYEIEGIALNNRDDLDTLMTDLEYSIIDDYKVLSVPITSSNTEILEGKIYTAGGNFQTNVSYSTLYYRLDDYAVSVNLRDFKVGVYGGAFLTEDKSWISSFATDGANVETTVPKNAGYIAVSVPVSSLYGRYLYVTTNDKRISFDKLSINTTVEENNEAITALTNALDYSTEDRTRQYEVRLLESNTEILEGKIYTAGGDFQTITSHSTLYYRLEGHEISVNLRGVKVGVYGGAFLTETKSWISSFATDGADAETAIPQDAGYIAVSVPVSNLYGRYLYLTEERTYVQLNNLDIDNLDIPKTNPGNHWVNKKILWMGTSVSFGQYATTSYVKVACDILGCEFLNVSVPGLAIHTNSDGSQKTYGSLSLSKAEYIEQGLITIPDSPIAYTPGGSYNNYYRTYENVFTEANADYDLYVFDVVPNNGNFGLTDWDAFNKDSWAYADGSDFADHRTTFLGALLFLMDKLYEINPTARVVFVLGSEFSYSGGKEALQVISDRYRIGIIDIWSKVNLTPKSKLYIYSEGGTNAHPSTYAHELLGKILANELILVI